jgi:hypothetical protein
MAFDCGCPEQHRATGVCLRPSWGMAGGGLNKEVRREAAKSHRLSAVLSLVLSSVGTGPPPASPFHAGHPHPANMDGHSQEHPQVSQVSPYAEFRLFVSTGGRRETSYYGRMIESQKQSFDCGLRIADWGQACGRTPALRPAALDLRGRIVRNKPNFRPSVRNEPNSRRPQVGRGLGDVERLGKTKPVWAERPGMGAGGRGREAPTGKRCKTNPIPRLRIADWRLRIGGTDFRQGRGLCKTNPIWRLSRRGLSRKTKPILPHEPHRQVLCGKRVMVNCTNQGHRQNKANFPGDAGWGRGASVQNEPNLPQTGREDHPQGLRP